MNAGTPKGAGAAADSGPFRLVSIFSRRQRAVYLAGVALWLVTLGLFWGWWLQPDHVIRVWSYVLLTLSMAWVTLLPVYFMVIYNGATRPAGSLDPSPDLRVAMVVTKAPSEPFSVVSKTLEAMLAQDLPHDTWLADEDPTPEVTAWCAEHDVRISTRKGCADYHRKTWPRRTRCKEGNLAYFYDHYGYDNYDVVSQLDADHVPDPGYLRQMVRPFADPGVGYVSAPSICDSNAAHSWAARGRLYCEANLHGALQAGYNSGWAPLCFGSHYAVRTAALRQIGGLGPELAEDHSTTLMMNAAGWRGVHAIDAIAHGAGPETFADLATQEFQWSRSLMTILLQYSPLYLPALSARLRFQFLFSQFWYPLVSVFMAISYATSIIALIWHQSFVNVSYPDFIVHFAPQTLVLIAVTYHWRSIGTFRPVDAKIVSWEGFVFLFARWPWTLAGSAAAVYEWATKKFVDFRVTPKGAISVDPVPASVLAPYFGLSLASALPALLIGEADRAAGFYIFAAMNAVLYAVITLVVLARHRLENTVRVVSPYRRSALAAALICVLALPGISIAAHGLEGLDAISNGAGFFTLTDRAYTFSGAGRTSTVGIITFHPQWTLGND